MSIKGLMGDRIFHIYDVDKNGHIDIIEFVSVTCRLFQASFESKLGLVFDIFDVDGDKYITAEDIRAILSHIPLDVITTCGSPKGRERASFPSSCASSYKIVIIIKIVKFI